MSGSTISSLITQTVTLGSSYYASPLTISIVGTVAPGAGGGEGIIIPAAAAYSLVNKGVVTGGAGNAGSLGTAGYSSGGLGGASGGQGGAGYMGSSGVYLAGPGSFSNHGIVSGGAGGAGGAGGDGMGSYGLAAIAGPGGAGGMGGAGVQLAGAGTASNTGTITGGAGGAGGAGGTSSLGDGLAGYAGTGGTGVILDSGAVLTNSGLISGGAANGGTGGAGIYLDGGTLITSGTIVGGAAGGAGSAGYAVTFGSLSSLLIIDPGARFTGGVAAQSAVADTLELSGTATAELNGIGSQFTNFSNISFAGGASWSIAGNSAGLAGGETIDGLTLSDQIDLTDFAATAESFVSGTGLVLQNAGGSVTLDITGSLTSASFSISSDGAQGTLIREEVTCFARGTRIATAQGELPVEALEIGMEVKTLQGGLRRIKWIGQRSYAAPFANNPRVLPILIRAEAIAPGVPARDLMVSPGHAICIDGHLIQALRLVNGISIKQLRKVERITYFHIELESHQVILAENCPAETFRGEYFRRQFENAASFQALYPGQAAPEAACLPELKQGFVLQDIISRLDARAGSTPPARTGPLRGLVEYLDERLLIGWAQDLAAPDQPVLLDIIAGGMLFGRIWPISIARICVTRWAARALTGLKLACRGNWRDR